MQLSVFSKPQDQSLTICLLFIYLKSRHASSFDRFISKRLLYLFAFRFESEISGYLTLAQSGGESASLRVKNSRLNKYFSGVVRLICHMLKWREIFLAF